MSVPLGSQGTGTFLAVNSAVLVIGDGPPAEAAILALKGHPVYWVGETAHSDGRIEGFPYGAVLKVRGQRGRFRVEVSGPTENIWLECGNIVLAPRLLSRLDPSLILPQSSLVRPVSSAASLAASATERVAFFLGEGENEGFSSSLTALNEAVRLAANGVKVYFFFLDAKVSARGLEEVYQRARKSGVRFVRLRDPSLLRVTAEENFLRLQYNDFSLPGRSEFSLNADTLFVGEVYHPGPDFIRLAGLLGVHLDRWGFFQEDNIEFFPVRTNRPGVYVLGEVRGAAFATEVKLEAAAISGETLPFLSGQILAPEVCIQIDSTRCSLCLNCYRNCPSSAIYIDKELETAVINPLACLGCGLCASECPAKAITLPKSEGAEQREGKTIVLACENSGYLAAKSLRLSPWWLEKLEIIPIPCAGRVDEVMVLTALAQGAQKIVVSACREECCRSSVGNRRAEARVLALKERLKTLGLSSNRIEIFSSSANESQEWLKKIMDLIDGIIELGR